MPSLPARSPCQHIIRTFFRFNSLSVSALWLNLTRMGMKDKLPGMSADEAVALLSKNGNLVKRPFVVGDGLVLAGFKEGEWAGVLG